MVRSLLTDLFIMGVLLITIGALLGGCALHSPMSQTLRFHDGTTQPSHRTSHEVGAGTGTLSSTQLLRPESTAPGVIRGTVYAGYALTLRKPVLTFGITTGIF